MYTFDANGLENYILGKYTKKEDIVGYDEIPDFLIDCFRIVDPSFLCNMDKEQILEEGKIDEILSKATESHLLVYNHVAQMRFVVVLRNNSKPMMIID